MNRYVRFGLVGCGGLLLLFFVLFVGILIGGSGTQSPDSAIEENEAEQDGLQEAPVEEAPAEEAPVEQEPVELSGTGPQATETFELSAGLVRFDLTHNGESNFIVYLLDEAGNENLVLSEIGSSTTSQALQVPEDGTYLLNVEAADGAWTINVS